MRLVLRNGGLHLSLDRLPDIVERSLASGKLAPVVVEGGVDAELIVRAAVTEMQTGRDGEVGLERDGKLVQDALAGGRGVGDEDAGFGGIVDAMGCVHELAHLEQSGPHGALTTGDRGPSLAVVEQLVHDHGTTQTQKTELHTTKLEEHGPSLVDDVQVVDLVLARPELLQHPDILAGSPNRIHRDVKLDVAGEQEGEFGEGQFVGRESGLDRTGASLLNGLLDGLGDERGVLRDVLQRPFDMSAGVSNKQQNPGLLFRDPVQRCVIVEAEVARVDDVIGVGLAGKIVEGVQVA